MSEADYQRIVQRVTQSIAVPTLLSDTGIETAQQLGALAAQEEVEWAIAGGLAMHLYGSERLTKDVDFIASKHLSLAQEHPLTFGGSRYSLQVGKYAVPIDWIVRNDGYQKFYHAALRDAVILPNGLRIVTPEWLVVLKFNAGRQKDLDDIVYLLRQKELVQRPIVKEHVVEIAGENGWLVMMSGFRRLCDLADGRTTEPGKYYDQE
jgi:hypothetical protein